MIKSCAIHIIFIIQNEDIFMSKSRLFDAKLSPKSLPSDDKEINKYYDQLYSEFFKNFTKPKYSELMSVLKALKENNFSEFMQVVDTLLKPTNKLELPISDYRQKGEKATYIVRFNNWSNKFNGNGKTLRKSLEPIHQKVLAAKQHEEKYKALCVARNALNSTIDMKEESAEDHWHKLHKVKRQFEDSRYFVIDHLGSSYHEAVIEKQADLFFKQTMLGLDAKSILVNFPRMLAVLVHGDHDLIIKAVKDGVTSDSFSIVKEKHEHIFKEKSDGYFDDVVDFMQVKLSSREAMHDFFDMIPLFIKKCIEHQEQLILEKIDDKDKELMEEDVRTMIIKLHLHETHSIKKNLHRDEVDAYIQVVSRHQHFDHIKKGHHYIIPSFAEYCEEHNKPPISKLHNKKR